jgi:hypothetical protein
VNEFELPAAPGPATDHTPTNVTPESQPAPESAGEATPDAVPAADAVVPEVHPETPPAPPTVDPVRSAAGRLGGQRVHRLAELGRQYEKEHGLTPGRQRLKQLIQLGKRYELEHGLRAPTPRRKRKGDAWAEFLAALARVVKPVHRAAVEQLAASLRPGPADRLAA